MKLKIKRTSSPYDEVQIKRYLTKIGYKDWNREPNLVNLEKLVRLHLIAFPFEALSIHYSSTHDVDVTPLGAFARMVEQDNGFGSYCFAHNTLFQGILQGLGYPVYAGAARVNRAPVTSPEVDLWFLAHMILFVTTSSDDHDQVYLVDVGFGGVFGMSGLIRPIRLRHEEVVIGSAPPEEHRLVNAGHTLAAKDQDLKDEWSLQGRCGADTWRTLYHFSETEFYAHDFEALSYTVSRREPGPFQTLVICIKVGETKNGYLERWVVVGNQVARRYGATKEVIQVCMSEKERVAALKEYCKVILDDDAMVNIEGRPSAIVEA